jgi:2-oxoisovalerate dehydrogenase E1 component alpha subunit
MSRKLATAASSTATSPPDLTAEDLLDVYRTMLLTRALDERVYVLNRQGKIPIAASCQGHEAAQIGSVLAMDRPNDLFFIYYRDIAATIALGFSVAELMLGYMGKAGAPFSGGRQFPYGGADPERRIINTSNVVGTQTPHAVGAALAFKMRREPGVVINYFGDGATSQGEWHEAMNYAGVHKLPIVFFCENNDYAISVPLRKQMAVEYIAERGAAYGMPGITVDGSDVLEVYRVTREAAERAREGAGPTLIEAKVARLMPHTTDDDERRYRSAEELENRHKRDPIPLLRKLLQDEGVLTEDLDARFQGEVEAEIDAATESGDQAPLPDPSTFYDHLFAS